MQEHSHTKGSLIADLPVRRSSKFNNVQNNVIQSVFAVEGFTKGEWNAVDIARSEQLKHLNEGDGTNHLSGSFRAQTSNPVATRATYVWKTVKNAYKEK